MSVILLSCMSAMFYKLRTKPKSKVEITNIVNEGSEPKALNPDKPSCHKTKCGFRSINDLPVY